VGVCRPAVRWCVRYQTQLVLQRLGGAERASSQVATADDVSKGGRNSSGSADRQFQHQHINRCLTTLLNWLREADPDIVCLHKLKAADAEFPARAIRQAGSCGLARGEALRAQIAVVRRRRRERVNQP
jgi:hypothetical protein